MPSELFKETPTCKAYIEGKNIEVRLKNVRISFAWLFTPQERRDDKTNDLTGYNFSVNALLSKIEREADIRLLSEVQKKVIELQWGTSTPPKIPAERRAVRDGEPKDPDTGIATPNYEGYEGMIFVSANKGVSVDDWEKHKKNPVQLLDSRKDANGKFPRLTQASGKLYSGCFADLIMRFYGYDGKTKNPNRVNAALEAVKFVRHGDAFGAKPVDADNAFDEEEGEEMDEEFETNSTAAGADDDLLG